MSTKFPGDFITVGVGSVSFNSFSENGNKVLRATGGNRTNLYICDSVDAAADVEFLFKIRSNNIAAHLGGGVLRYVDVDNYYVFRTRGLRLEVGKVVAGKFILIASLAKNLSNNTWYWWRIRALYSGLSFEFSSDGVNFTRDIFCYDPAFSSGKVGFYANNRNAAGAVDWDDSVCNGQNVLL